MNQSGHSRTCLCPASPPLPLAVDFHGGRLTSDGGWAFVAEAEAAPGLTAALTTVLPEHRRRRAAVRWTMMPIPRRRAVSHAA